MSFSNLVLGAGAAFTVMAVAAGCGAGEKPAAPPPGPLGEATVRSAIAVGRSPVGVAIADGVVWVADQAGFVQRVDARTRRRLGRPVAVGRAPFAVAIGEGAVWVAGGDGLVRALDPRTAEVRGRPVAVPGANGLAAGAGGVWVTSRIAGTVTRIDPRTLRTDPPIRVGAGPADVIIVDDAVWVANAAEGTVSRVDPDSRSAAAPIDVGGSGILALANGEEGLWAARTVGVVGNRREVVELDTETGAPIGKAIGVMGGVPLDLAVGAGSVWATDVGGVQPPAPPRPGAVTRIDPRDATLAGPALRVGRRPSAIAVGPGGVWVTSSGDGHLTPIGVTP